MSEIRFDPVTGRNVIIAETRADRPSEFQQLEFRRTEAICPFCKGNEEDTPPPIATWDAEGRLFKGLNCDDWVVRVVPNKYPALVPNEGDDNVEIAQEDVSGPYERAKISGSHELVIETPKHYASWSQLSERELQLTLEAMRYRVDAHQRSGHIAYTSVFKNCRPAAGASLEHAHAQILGMSQVPDYIQALAKRNQHHRSKHNQSLIESITQWEIEAHRRILVKSELFTAFCPYASRFPYQVWITPNPTEKPFYDLGKDAISELAVMSRQCIRSIELLLDFPAYNWVLYLPPLGEQFDQSNWLVEIFPRTARQAGFEMQTDCWINQTSPESAASQLKIIDE